MAAVNALVGASVATVEAAIGNSGSLVTAWRAALANTAPTVPGVDPTNAALILEGWVNQ
jgi:hypothetical protein